MSRLRTTPARETAHSAPESRHSAGAYRKCLIREENRAMKSGHIAISGMCNASNGAAWGHRSFFLSLLFKLLKEKEKRQRAATGRAPDATPRVAAVSPGVGERGRAARHESGPRHVSDAWRHTARHPLTINALRTRDGQATSPRVALRVGVPSGRRGGRR
jgi:hypothetical protein